MQSLNSLYPKFTDSEGYIDLTRFFSASYIFGKASYKDKMYKLLAIFQLIDENGDGFLSKSEVEKFFRIILYDTFNIFKNIGENPSEYPIFNWSPEKN